MGRKEGKKTRGGWSSTDLERFALICLDRDKKMEGSGSKFSASIGLYTYKQLNFFAKSRGAVKILTFLCDAFKHLYRREKTFSVVATHASSVLVL